MAIIIYYKLGRDVFVQQIFYADLLEGFTVLNLKVFAEIYAFETLVHHRLFDVEV